MTTAAPAAAPATSAPAAPATPPAADPAAPTATGFEWLGTEGVTDEIKGFTQNKGWKTGRDAIEGYRNLEKLLGADRAGRTVVLPKDDADKDGWNALFSKLGRPETADKYDIPVPKGTGSEEFAKAAKDWFHEAGLTPKQAKAVAEKWNGYVDAQLTAQNAETTAKSEQGQAKLKSEWGAAYDQNVAIAQKAAKGLGFTQAELDAMESVVGYDGVFKRMHALGAKLGEAEFVTGGTQPVGGKMTPEQAKAEIANLRKDNEFVKKYVAGDVEAKRRMEDLHKMAYPE